MFKYSYKASFGCNTVEVDFVLDRFKNNDSTVFRIIGVYGKLSFYNYMSNKVSLVNGRDLFIPVCRKYKSLYE
nr:hypothetical protein B11C_110103 [Bartonella sp. 1-1C]